MIECEVDIPTSPKHVWLILTQESDMRSWWSDNITFTKKRGAKFSLNWHGSHNLTHGMVTLVEENTLLQLAWQDDGWLEPTRVEFLLTPTSRGTKLCVQHSGWGIFDDKRRSDVVDAYQRSWNQTLESLKNLCIQRL